MAPSIAVESPGLELLGWVRVSEKGVAFGLANSTQVDNIWPNPTEERGLALSLERLAILEAPLIVEKCELVSPSLDEILPPIDDAKQPPRPYASEFCSRICFNLKGKLLCSSLNTIQASSHYLSA